jgi:hypothetical protein
MHVHLGLHESAGRLLASGRTYRSRRHNLGHSAFGDVDAKIPAFRLFLLSHQPIVGSGSPCAGADPIGPLFGFIREDT